MTSTEINTAAEAENDAWPVRKIHSLLSYVENLGLDPVEIADSVGLDIADVLDATPDESIPSIYYALLYKESVVRLQRENRLIPWAAGLGSDAFRMMCYCIISCTTLREALQRAQEYDALLYPITGHRIEFEVTKSGSGLLRYLVDDTDAWIEKVAEIGYRPIWYMRYTEDIVFAYLEREGDSLLLEFLQMPGHLDPTIGVDPDGRPLGDG